MRWLSKFKIIIFIGCLFCINNLVYSEEWPPDIDILYIYFNYETGYTNDAIKIKNIYSPEWGANYNNDFGVAYIKSQTSRKLKAQFYTDYEDLDEIAVWADKIDGTGFGDVEDGSADFNGTSYSTLALCDIMGSAPSSVGKETITWRWYCSYLEGYELEEDFLIGDSQFDALYVLLAAPQSPMSEPWVEVLDYACQWASGKSTETSALTEITKKAYDIFEEDHEYDGNYTHAPGTTFSLTDFFDEDWADCRDMSAVVHVFTRAIGGSSTQVRMINTTSSSNGFWYKPITPIGASTTTGYNWWNFHQVGWKSNVWDACLELNPNTTPRIAVDEDINDDYKDDLYIYRSEYGYTSSWSPQTPKNYTTIN